jgi:hypothetical protein
MKTRLVALAVIVSLMPVPACTTKKTVSVAPNQLPELQRARILSVTSLDGRDIAFRSPGGTLRGDRIVGTGSTPTPFEISAADVKLSRVAKRKGESRVDSLTTRDGKEIQFLPPGGLLKSESISGDVYEPIEVPLDQVQRVWVEKKTVAVGKTVGLVLLVGLLVAAIAVADTEPEPPLPSRAPSCTPGTGSGSSSTGSRTEARRRAASSATTTLSSSTFGRRTAPTGSS